MQVANGEESSLDMRENKPNDRNSEDRGNRRDLTNPSLYTAHMVHSNGCGCAGGRRDGGTASRHVEGLRLCTHDDERTVFNGTVASITAMDK